MLATARRRALLGLAICPAGRAKLLTAAQSGNGSGSAAFLTCARANSGTATNPTAPRSYPRAFGAVSFGERHFRSTHPAAMHYLEFPLLYRVCAGGDHQSGQGCLLWRSAFALLLECFSCSIGASPVRCGGAFSVHLRSECLGGNLRCRDRQREHGEEKRGKKYGNQFHGPLP